MSHFAFRSPLRSARPSLPSESFRLSWRAAPALSAEAGAGASDLPILVATDSGQSCREAGVPVRASVSGTGAERRARCPRGNVRVCPAPSVLAKIFSRITTRQRGKMTTNTKRQKTAFLSLHLCLGMVLLASSLAQAARLEIPDNGDKLSGIGVISGWKCEAEGRLLLYSTMLTLRKTPFRRRMDFPGPIPAHRATMTTATTAFIASLTGPSWVTDNTPQ